MLGCTGSLRYMAPEVALNQPYNEKVDMYSYAIILYEIITGCAPFSGLNRDQFHAKVITNAYRPDFEYDDYGRQIYVRPHIQNIVSKCWDPLPSTRLTAKEVFEVVRAEELDAIKKTEGQNFLKKTATSFFGKKDTI